MKLLSFRQTQRVASSPVASTAQQVPLGAEETQTPRALVPVRRTSQSVATSAARRPQWLRPLDQARRQLATAGFFEDVLRPVGSGFVQALFLHALHPGAMQAPASPQRPLRTWLKGQWPRSTAPNPGHRASSTQTQPSANCLPPEGAALVRHVHVEVHTWTAGAATSAVTVDIVTVQSTTHDTDRS